eukprot:TRINITY_DN1987_c0_g1_i1.p1 TRINITY_DN1987_c0_g1~~TRINITY_DN1987_c0_g1_i1.p1  ORF type:complete len:298 (-),score=45.52 TRINITY_DN1987_c0_g1_i1:382-1275(-)
MEDASKLINEGVRYYAALDANISKTVFAAFKWSGNELVPSPATQGLPFVDSPTPVLLGVLTYLSVVGLGYLWLKLTGLKPRVKEPWLFFVVIVLHNLFLFALSLYMCTGIVYQAIKNKYTLWGNGYKPDEVEMARLLYLFYVSKYFEFFDTIIMIVKRSTRQISVLHVYHHSSIALIWWTIIYHAPGGEAYFSAALNSFVHVVMYWYYFVAAVLGKDEKLKRKYLWWGKYLTQLQMTQFAINMVQAAYLMVTYPPYPRFLYTLLFYYMVSLLCLFANFYVQKYIVQGQKVQERRKVE